MILQAILQFLLDFVKVILDWIPNVPSVPKEFSTSVNIVFDTIFYNMQLFGLFIHLELFVVAVPLVIILINFDKVYSMIIWVIKKIPFIGSE